MRDGRQVKRSFSIRKYGYEGAFRLAAETRRQFTGQAPSACPPIPDRLRAWLGNLPPVRRGRALVSR